MKSIVLKTYNGNIIRAMIGLKVEETELPVPNSNEVLIEIHAAPVNPSDIAFIQGAYNIIKTLPAVPGFEASGKIIDAGKDSKHLIGKKVSCFTQDDRSGTWSQFAIAGINDIILLKDEMDLDQGACFTVNPFTAYGLFDIALQHNSKAIIQNGAGGQVADFVRKMAIDNGIEVIDIVRKQNTADKLINDGAKHVFVETDIDFVEKLADCATKLEASVAFDSVAGTLGGIMYNVLCEDAELVVYGGLSGKPIDGINPMDVIFKNKIISGFNLVDWKDEIGDDEFIRVSELLQDGFISNKYSTSIKSKTKFEDVVLGLRSYISDMSGGKLLLIP